ncbi:MAG TPA: hypothetical protein VGB52_12590 [Actinomycetota bacterium]
MTAAAITQQRACDAMLAWQHGARRRRIAGAAERAADAALAAGGIVLANAATPLGLGLPSGRPGTALGMSLLGAGFAWMLRNRPGRHTEPLRTVEARAVVNLEAWRAA